MTNNLAGTIALHLRNELAYCGIEWTNLGDVTLARLSGSRVATIGYYSSTNDVLVVIIDMLFNSDVVDKRRFPVREIDLVVVDIIDYINNWCWR